VTPGFWPGDRTTLLCRGNRGYRDLRPWRIALPLADEVSWRAGPWKWPGHSVARYPAPRPRLLPRNLGPPHPASGRKPELGGRTSRSPLQWVVKATALSKARRSFVRC